MTVAGAIERDPGPMSLNGQVGDHFRENFLITAPGGCHACPPLPVISETGRRETGRDTARREFRLG